MAKAKRRSIVQAINVISSPKDRPPGDPKPAPAPQTLEEWQALTTKSVAELRELGCRAWDEPDADSLVLMLFPFEWFDSIPRGLICYTIMDKKIVFDPQLHAQRDKVWGLLPFGLRVRFTH